MATHCDHFIKYANVTSCSTANTNTVVYQLYFNKKRLHHREKPYKTYVEKPVTRAHALPYIRIYIFERNQTNVMYNCIAG